MAEGRILILMEPFPQLFFGGLPVNGGFFSRSDPLPGFLQNVRVPGRQFHGFFVPAQIRPQGFH